MSSCFYDLLCLCKFRSASHPTIDAHRCFDLTSCFPWQWTPRSVFGAAMDSCRSKWTIQSICPCNNFKNCFAYASHMSSFFIIFHHLSMFFARFNVQTPNCQTNLQQSSDQFLWRERFQTRKHHHRVCYWLCVGPSTYCSLRYQRLLLKGHYS